MAGRQAGRQQAPFDFSMRLVHFYGGPQGSPAAPVPAAAPHAYTPAAAVSGTCARTRCGTRCGGCIEHGVPQRVPPRVRARRVNPVGHRTFLTSEKRTIVTSLFRTTDIQNDRGSTKKSLRANRLKATPPRTREGVALSHQIWS